MVKSTRMFVPAQLPLSVSPTDKLKDDIRYTPVTNIGGCFTKGTTVLKGLCEGMDISSLTPQTVYLGGEGVPGKVSNELPQYTTQADMLIYGFNKETPFFTEDHPFATQNGWRAINPVAAKKISPWLEVGPLEVGDYVKRISVKMGPRGFEYKLQKIVNITMDTLPAGSSLYGIHSHEGPKSYHANGYLVHMNFPVISSDKLQKSIIKVFKTESQSLVQNVIEPLIKDMYGQNGHMFLQNLKKGLEVKKSSSLMSHIPLEEVVLLHMPLLYEMEDGVGYDHPADLSLIRGQVYLDGEYIESAVMINEHQIVWTRYLGGRLQHGNVHLNPNRMTGYGRISTEEYATEASTISYAASTAKSLVQTAAPTSVKFTTMLSSNVYNCQVSVASIPDDKTVSKGEMNDWGTLIMGYEKDPTTGSMKPVGKVTMPPLISEPDNLNNGVVFSVNKDSQALMVAVHVPSEYCALPGGPKYIHMEGTFNWDFSSLKGKAKEYDSSKQGFEGRTFEWQGQIVHNETALATLQQSRSASLLTQKTYTSSAKSMLAMSSNVSVVHPDSIALAELTKVEDLSLEELFTLIAPPQSETHTLTFDMIKKMMEHEIPDDWRTNILGISKPDIGNLEGFAKEHHEFLANKFGISYIGFALSKSNHFSKSFTETEKNKLLYYWSGDAKTSLSQNKDYHNTNTVVATNAFIKESEKLQKYMNSDPGGWAKKLFDHLCLPYVMNGFVLSLDVSQSNVLLQKQCMVLQCLDPATDYGSKLYHKVVVLRLSNIGATYKGSMEDESYLQDFIYNAFSQMITRILNGDDDLGSTISDQLRKLLKDSMDEVNATGTIDYMTSMKTLLTQVVSMWGKGTGVVMQRMANAVTDWAKTHPKLAFTGKVIGCFSSLAMYGFLAYNIVSQFMNWKSLSPEQKVLVIANTVSFIFSTIAKIPSIIESFQEVKTSFYNFDFVKKWIAATNSTETQIAEQEHMDDQVRDVEKIPEDEVLMRESEQAVENGGLEESSASTTSRFKKVFNIADKVAKMFNIVALSAACIAMGFQIARDFKENQPVSVKALDISQAAVIGLQIAVEVTALVFENAMLSTLGSALALAGIVLAIIVMIIGRKPPTPEPTPADNFIKNNSKPFLTSLIEPTKKWVDDYHGRNPETKSIRSDDKVPMKGCIVM